MLAVLVSLLAGCSALLHADAIRLCRSLAPVFNGPATPILVRRTDASRTVHGLLVVIAYSAAGGSEAGNAERRAVSCVFREGGPQGQLELTNLATEDGPVGEVRLHFLKRHWIDKGHAAANDPQPIALASPLVDVSTPVAGALQALLAGAPGVGLYALLAAAYALIYGLVGRINLAFGELAMLAGYGGFLGYWMAGGTTTGTAALAGALLVGIATAVVHGGALGRAVFDRLAARPGQHILIATLGLSIAWSEAARLSQGTGNRWLPPLSGGPIAIARADDMLVTVTAMGLAVPLLAALALLACRWVIHATAFGRAWQATADDPLAAALCGVDPRRTTGITMLLASVLTGLAGVLMLFFYGGVGHAGGIVIGLKALIAAVVGGIGSVRAAVLGALAIGVAEIIWSHLVSVSSRDLALVSALALILVLRPDGLFQRR